MARKPVIRNGAFLGGLAVIVTIAWIYGVVRYGRLFVNEPMRVKVVTEQFTWHFHYPGPDGIFGPFDPVARTAENPLGLDLSDPASMDDFHSAELVLPCATPVTLEISAIDVMHGLGDLPGFDPVHLIPGRETPSHSKTPSKPGSGVLRCNVLCGHGHPGHHAPYRFLKATEFEAWERERGPVFGQGGVSPGAP